MSRSGTGVTRTQWIEIGQELLRRDGIEGVKLTALTKLAGVSSGSFYHHFPTIDDFLKALADYYATEQWPKLIALAEEHKPTDPSSRLRALGLVSRDTQFKELVLAMRAWANSSRDAANAIRAFDQMGFPHVVKELKAMGFSPKQAKVRAFLMIASSSVEFDLDLTGLSEQELGRIGFDLLTAPQR